MTPPEALSAKELEEAMTQSQQPAPLSESEIEAERKWCEEPGIAAGVFDKSTVVHIERRFIATIDERDATIQAKYAALAAVLKLCDETEIRVPIADDAWRAAVIVKDLRAALNAPSEAHGTFACPICGHDKPHAHSKEDIEFWLDAQASRFGYRLTSELCKIASFGADETDETLAAQDYTNRCTRWDSIGIISAFHAGVAWIREKASAAVALARQANRSEAQAAPVQAEPEQREEQPRVSDPETAYRAFCDAAGIYTLGDITRLTDAAIRRGLDSALLAIQGGDR